MSMAFNAQAGADALGAIREAIQMYMGLRQQRIDNQSRDAADSRAARQLELQEQNAELAATTQRETQLKNQRDLLLDVIDRFGGQETTQGPQFRAAGLADAVEPIPGLQARTLPTSIQPTGGPDSAVQTLERYSQGPDTGRERIRMPEGERTRIAYWNNELRKSEGAANRDTRVQVANIGAQSRLDVAAARQQANDAIAQARLAMQKYGIDMNAMTQARVLSRLMGNDQANFDARQFQLEINALRADPFSFIRRLDEGAPPLVPPTLTPQPPGIGAAGGTSGRFREEPVN